VHALLLAAALATQGPDGSRGDRLVRVELLADRATVAPGDTLTLAVKLAVEPGWHIYWQNPGDSGVPTRFELSGSEGFEIGEVRFPLPEREVAEGDIVTYVHKGEVLFLADVRAPKDASKLPAAGSKLAFGVEASWLACTEVCFAGSGKARVELPIAAAGAASKVANEKVFADARTRLPRPWKELEGATLAWSGSGERRELAISVRGATAIELFPSLTGNAELEGRAVASDAGSARLTADLRIKGSAPPGPPRLVGVLAVKTAQGQASFQLDTTPDRNSDQTRIPR